MKKIFIYLLTAIIAVSSLAFPAYADNDFTYDVDALYAEAMELYDEYMQDTENSTVQAVNSMFNATYHMFIVHQKDNGDKYLSVITSPYSDISYNPSENIVRGTELYYTYFQWNDTTDFGCRSYPRNVGSSTSTSPKSLEIKLVKKLLASVICAISSITP